MTLMLRLYRGLTSLATPLVPHLLARRERAGKEPPGCRHQRLARDLPSRPVGKLVWFHGASVGESLVLAALCERLQNEGADFSPLFTTQTRTAYGMLATRGPDNCLRQLAPVDTPGAAQRFVDHWQPDLAIFGEGEIWPNILTSLQRFGVETALINARMTEKSLRGWARFPDTAREAFGSFSLILSSNEKTANGLSVLTGRAVESVGNLKTAIPLRPPTPQRVSAFERDFLQGRQCFLAASTHAGEEELVLDAWEALSTRPALILAPRHPGRGDELADLLRDKGLNFIRLSSASDTIDAAQVCLADTMGDMPLWLALADWVYLGGGHAPGVGGHNPMEPVQAGKPIFTGPELFNFSGVFEPLIKAGAARIVTDAPALTAALQAPVSPLDEAALAQFFADADAPMATTVDQLMPLLVGGRDV